jgi:hypothetical protein
MPGWLRLLLTRQMLICVFTGFSSGLPLYLLLNLLPAWLRSEGVNLKTIGFFALIQFPYTWKFLWSPLLDRYRLPLGAAVAGCCSRNWGCCSPSVCSEASRRAAIWCR